MAADVFTKAFLVDAKLKQARMLIGVVTPDELWSRLPVKTKTTKAAPAPLTSDGRKHKYTVIECCCGNDSTIGKLCPSDQGCRVIRLTIEDDILSTSGKRKLFNACRYEPFPILWFYPLYWWVFMAAHKPLAGCWPYD